MEAILDTQSILNNAVAGVTAGIVVSMILGIYQLVRGWLDRQRQIHHVSELISVGIESIQGVNDDRTRLLILNLLLRNAESFLASSVASDRITYREKERLLAVFPLNVDGSVAYLDNAGKLPEDADGYFEKSIEQFRRIPWLKLDRPGPLAAPIFRRARHLESKPVKFTTYSSRGF